MAASKKSSSAKKLTPDRIMQSTWAFSLPLMLEAAIHNRVFDVLEPSPKTLEQIARETGAAPRGLRALLNALVGVHFLTRRGKKYALVADVAAFLVSTKPAFIGGVLRHLSSQLIPNWLHLSEIVRTGYPVSHVNQKAFGSEFFAQFVEDIFNTSYAPARVAAQHLHGKSSKPLRLLDIAAGSGVWGIAFAQQNPLLQVTAVDWPGVIPVTRRVATRFGVADRFTYCEGDILTTDFGQNYNVATLGHILHSEGESRNRKLLRKVFDALSPGGTIVIAEFTPDQDRTGPALPLIFAVNMLVMTEQGDTFTFKEVRSWLQETGFKKIRQLAAPGPSPLILAQKP